MASLATWMGNRAATRVKNELKIFFVVQTIKYFLFQMVRGLFMDSEDTYKTTKKV